MFSSGQLVGPQAPTELGKPEQELGGARGGNSVRGLLSLKCLCTHSSIARAPPPLSTAELQLGHNLLARGGSTEKKGAGSPQWVWTIVCPLESGMEGI